MTWDQEPDVASRGTGPSANPPEPERCRAALVIGADTIHCQLTGRRHNGRHQADARALYLPDVDGAMGTDTTATVTW